MDELIRQIYNMISSFMKQYNRRPNCLYLGQKQYAEFRNSQEAIYSYDWQNREFIFEGMHMYLLTKYNHLNVCMIKE